MCETVRLYYLLKMFGEGFVPFEKTVCLRSRFFNLKFSLTIAIYKIFKTVFTRKSVGKNECFDIF
jgi:hypothetical protein